jgi:Tfp pilus assembly protein PilF
MKIASWQLCCYDPGFSAIPPQPAMRRYSFLLLGLAIFSGGQSFAAPYVPTADSRVLEHLPFKLNDPVARELAQMRATLQRDPRNLDVAVALARRYYEMVGEEGDPRYLGYAQAALAPWWEMPTPPAEVQVLRASLRQFRHDFAGAVTDLTQVIERNPANPQARALRAIIHVVQARYMLARSDCQVLRQVGDPLIGLGCIALVDGLTGNAGAAYQSLSIALTNTSGLSTSKELWLQLRLAELARRLGRNALAETHFKRALALGITDTFLLAAYADFLLDQKRPAEVVALLKDRTRSDTLLLRLVFAERALHLATAVQRAATLEARYAAAQLRGDTVHQQEEARFSLEVRHDPRKALTLAQENWKVQREPSDARIFLEAALAAHEPAAARPVFQWLDENHIEDRYLAELGQQLKREFKR